MKPRATFCAASWLWRFARDDRQTGGHPLTHMNQSVKRGCDSRANSRRWHLWLELALVVVAQILVFAITTWPFALSPLSRIIGWPGDNLQHLWSLWWAKHAWLDLRQSLGNVSVFYHPLGMDHSLMGTTVWNQFLLLPVTALFGPTIAYNTAVVLAYALTGLATYALIRYLTRSQAGALFGSVAFTFCAARMSHIYAHLANITMYWFPLGALALFWLNDKLTWRRAVVTGIVLWTGMLVNFKSIITFLMPVSVVLGSWFLSAAQSLRQKTRCALMLATVAAVAAGLWLPIGAPLLGTVAQGDGGFLFNFGVESNSASLLGFLAPSWRNPLLPDVPAAAEFLEKVNGFWIETLVYVGIATLALAVIGARAAGKQAVPWLILIAGCGILALGPFLKIAGEPVMLQIEGAQHKAALPWAYLAQLPVLNLLRTPGRFAQPMMLGVAVLAGFGAAWVHARLKGRPVIRPVALGALAFVAAFEGVVVFPTRTFGPSSPPFFRQIAQGGKPGALLTYPSLNPLNPGTFEWLGTELQMLHQTTHQRPITSGYIWRVDDTVYGAIDQLENAIDPAPGRDIFPKPDNLSAYLHSLGFAYVVVYKHQDTVSATRLNGARPDDVARIRPYLIETLGVPVYEDDEIVAFEVPDAAANAVFLATRQGWYGVEGRAEGHARRWTTNQASLYVRAPVSTTARLELEYRPFAPTYTLQLAYGDLPIGLSTHVDSDSRLIARSEPFVIGPGQTSIRLTSEAGCSPVEPISTGFKRCVAFYVSRIELIPAP